MRMVNLCEGRSYLVMSFFFGNGGNAAIAEACGSVSCVAASLQMCCDGHVSISPFGSVCSTKRSDLLILAIDASLSPMRSVECPTI